MDEYTKLKLMTENCQPGFSVETYSPALKNLWDEFVSNGCKNSTFLHRRDYMDYHADRFEDCSLVIKNEDKVIALFPACYLPGSKRKSVSSHAGLTYGGVLLSESLGICEGMQSFRDILIYYNTKGVTRIVYKCVPSIYCDVPSDEDRYAIFITNGILLKRDVTFAIGLSFKGENLRFKQRRIRGIKKAQKNGFVIKKDEKLADFWENILTPTLQDRHKARPVHSIDEMLLLKKLFPQNIVFYSVQNSKGEVVAGVVMYITDRVAHAQYIASNEEGRKFGALDMLFNFLIKKEFSHLWYFDFGICNEANGRKLNRGLATWKEEFGARAVAHDFYEISPANFHLLNRAFL